MDGATPVLTAPDLRDMFAAHALTGLLAGLPANKLVSPGVCRQVSLDAYALADAMLAEREKWRTEDALNGRR